MIGNIEMDSNADTCVLGQNFIVTSYSQRSAEVYAYDKDLPSTVVPIVSGATAYTCPTSGHTFILIVNEALYYGTRLDHSLFNQNQIRKYKIPLWDNPFDAQRPLGIETDQLFIPFETSGTKVQFQCRAPTSFELEECPHIELTSKVPWNPNTVQLSTVQTVKEPEYEDPRSNDAELRHLDPLQHAGTWRQLKQITATDPRFDDIPVQPTFTSTQRHSKITAEGLSERFNISTERARATLRATTQRGTRSAILPLARRYRADRFIQKPLLKGHFSTDTAYFRHKSLRGNTCSQIYFHKSGFYTNTNMPKADDGHVGPTLTKFVSDFGIPERLTMDGAVVQTGRHTSFMSTIRRCQIDHHISHPYKPNENPAEGGIRELKRRFYRLQTKHGIPERLWDFLLDYVVDIMNTTVNYSRYSDGRVPLEVITGITPDITEYLDFTIYGWVFYRTDGGLGTNHIGRWLGVSHRVGPSMTYWVLPISGRPISTDTVQAVTQAEMQTEVVKNQMEKWKEGTKDLLDTASSHVPWKGDEIPKRSIFDMEEEDEDFKASFNTTLGSDKLDEEDPEEADDVNATNYVNMEVGLPRGPDGELHHARVKRRIVDEEGRPTGVAHTNQMLDTRQYEVEYEDGEKEILAANLLAENIMAQVDEHGHKHRMFEEMTAHRKSAKAVNVEDGWFTTRTGTKRRRRTTRGWEIYITWKDGSSNWIQLKDLKESFPTETAMYAVEKGIDKEPAFAWWVSHTLRRKDRSIKKVKSKYWERTHKYGIQIPKTVEEALRIDKENGDHLWGDAIKMEMTNNRVAFEEFGGDVSKLVGYKRITAHLIFDVKLGENFRRKARYVADGHKTGTPTAMTYSTVVGRDSVRIMLTIAALNGLDVQCADIQNAFLTAPNLEKCYMVAGPEFLDEAGKTFIVKRALYGLRSAGAAFRSFLAGKLEALGFMSSYADPEVWMRPAVKPDGEEYYEYILCYVDDIMCMSMNAEDVMIQLQYQFKFKKDKIEPPETYLGARLKLKNIDGDNMWSISSYDYIKAAIENVQSTISKGTRWKFSKKAPTPMVMGFEPELDESPELEATAHTFYQELIGMLRWAIELGRVDILFEVSLLSQYQACPREGHMEQLMHIFSYLKQYPKLSLYMNWRFAAHERNYKGNSPEEFREIYRDAKEELPKNMPKPRGREVETLGFVDASHGANKKTRRSHSGYLIFLNKAPIVWFSKKQNTVEASTFGSEFIALKSCVEAITHLRFKLRMFGVPLSEEPTTVLCDNEAVVNNSSNIASTLNKKHNSIAYHYVRWNVAAGIVRLQWLSGDFNLSDAFTKRLTQQRRGQLFGNWTYF